MANPRSRALAVIGSLLALNVGLFVFNNLPIIPVRESGMSRKVIRQARETAKEAREMARTARAEAREARRQAKSAVRDWQSATKSDRLMGLDQLSKMRHSEHMNKLQIRIDPPASPRIAVLPPAPKVHVSGPGSPDACTRRVTLHQYLRDHVM